MLAQGQRGERQNVESRCRSGRADHRQQINETARGDPDALAARIVAAWGEAGYRVVPANGKKDTLLGLQPDKYRMEQLYRSPNGDSWFHARDPAGGLGTVRHQANASSGGQV